mgnify:FL=1
MSPARRFCKAWSRRSLTLLVLVPSSLLAVGELNDFENNKDKIRVKLSVCRNQRETEIEIERDRVRYREKCVDCVLTNGSP